MSKFSKMDDSGTVVSSCRIFGMVKMAKKYSSVRGLAHSLFVKYRSPSFSVFILQVNALKSALIVGKEASISCLRRTRRNTKIAFSVIERVVVLMVNLTIIRSLKYLSVHSNAASVLSSNRVPNSALEMGLPRPLGEPFVIVGINNGHLSSRERDESNGRVGGLLNIWTINGFNHNNRPPWGKLYSGL